MTANISDEFALEMVKHCASHKHTLATYDKTFIESLEGAVITHNIMGSKTTLRFSGRQLVVLHHIMNKCTSKPFKAVENYGDE